jgi:hypothetical protein
MCHSQTIEDLPLQLIYGIGDGRCNFLTSDSLLFQQYQCIFCNHGSSTTHLGRHEFSRVQFSHLGLELTKLGHDVRVLAPSNARIPDVVHRHRNLIDVGNRSTTDADSVAPSGGKFIYTTYDAEGDVTYYNTPEYSDTVWQIALSKSYVQKFRLMVEIMRKASNFNLRDCQGLIGNRTVMEDLRNGGYQFVAMDPSTMAYAIPLTLGVPYALVG